VSGGPDVIIIKKKPKHAGAHGAAWKVAYADFVTAMMALFMVLWLVSQTDQKMKKSLSDYFRTGVFSGAPSLLEGGSGVSDRGFVDTSGQDEPAIIPMMLERDAETVRGAINQAVNSPDLKDLADMVTVKVTDSGILIQIAEGRDDLLFDLSSSDLKPELVKLLADVAPTLAHLGYALELHGHTDGRPFPAGSTKNNWTLSFQRAESARSELVKNGVPPELIAGVYAHGDTQPVVKDPKSPMNRRLAIFARRVVTAKSDGKGSKDKAAPDKAKGADKDGKTGERATGRKGAEHASAKEPSGDEETAADDESTNAEGRAAHH
jgi:chemotaxis protein MotB